MASSANLFLMELLDKFEAMNLHGIMLEHTHWVMTAKHRRHVMAYGYLLNRVFKHLSVPLGKGVASLSPWECEHPHEPDPKISFPPTPSILKSFPILCFCIWQWLCDFVIFYLFTYSWYGRCFPSIDDTFPCFFAVLILVYGFIVFCLTSCLCLLL